MSWVSGLGGRRSAVVQLIRTEIIRTEIESMGRVDDSGDSGDPQARLEAGDPWYAQRAEMPVHEFDAVHFFLNQPGRSAPPVPKLLAYLDCGLTAPLLADRLAGMLAELAGVLADTVAMPMRLAEAEWFMVGEGERGQPWDQTVLPALTGALFTGRLLWFGVRFAAEDDTRTWYLHGSFVPAKAAGQGAAGQGAAGPDAAGQGAGGVGTEAAVQLSLVPSRDLWPASDVDTVARRLLDLVEAWTPELDLRTGCVTYDRSGVHRSPYELWYNLDYLDTAPLTRARVRGYYWANLLTAGHVARLGGLDTLRDRAMAVGCRLQVLAGAGSAPPAALLLAPGPISAFGDDRLATMKALLEPVLINKRYGIYQGYPLRIVPDPGTAFRRLPQGSPMPRLLPSDEAPG